MDSAPDARTLFSYEAAPLDGSPEHYGDRRQEPGVLRYDSVTLRAYEDPEKAPVQTQAYTAGCKRKAIHHVAEDRERAAAGAFSINASMARKRRKREPVPSTKDQAAFPGEPGAVQSDAPPVRRYTCSSSGRNAVPRQSSTTAAHLGGFP